ncbi:glutamate--tRNA ligase [Akkermansiaceae bacterium]|nr:glutamate--tRNA ligase [Verrucomicrobiota bacterium]MDA7658519.1 glutamate--tRNA ligase [Akkermansiaceae bacterium]MDA7661462.1 glutamate--tRNA ligase [bacterium]MDB4701113.1 glutamate--tRNA ligase [Akkermansiaceae bacterium]MDB4761886.1 glutamate--tRNA ligase [bacterium]
MSTQVRTRFAPSPTGYLHVGGARTALFNWLYAKHHGGTFVLRVEDTDETRNTEAARSAIFEGMEWLGLDWEGPGNEGDCGPYYQSQRSEIYLKWFEKLVEKNCVYEDEGAWRFRFERKLITMNDLVCGEVTIDYRDDSNTPDMVIRRSDGSFVFHFVNVVDDLTMGITHAIRGEDHLMNTPKHLQLFEAFGATPPKYAHIPLILNGDGSKMSKRDEGAALGDYPREGFLPGAVVNFLALLGWSPKDESEIFATAELIQKFSLDTVNRAPARFDPDKCRWVNQQHILELSAEEFASRCESQASPEMLNSVKEKVTLLTEVPDAVAFYLDSEFPINSDALTKVKGNESAGSLLNNLAENLENLEDWSFAKETISLTAKATGSKPGQLMFPLRIALSGKSGGPDLEAILTILGKKECLRRLQRFINLLA